MWKRLSEAEVNRDIANRKTQRRSLRNPLVFATIFTLFFFFARISGFRGGDLRTGIFFVGESVGINEMSLLEIIFFPVIFFGALCYGSWHQRKTGYIIFKNSVARICIVCHQVDSSKLSCSCTCGGNLESADHWDWVDD